LGILALVFGVRLARSIIRPIRMLESGTERIAAGNWDHRVDIRTGDELEALARRFNGMAERLGNLHHSLESEVAERTRQLTERLEDLATLLATSTALSATLEMDQLLSLMAERMTRTLKTTYCRIALIDADHPEPVIRAAYPIRMLDWEPGIGRVLEPQALPDIRTAFETLRYVILSREAISSPERAIERGQMLTPETQSALIFPLILRGHPEGVIILGEARLWEREPFSPEKIALCQTMANQAVIAIANARNYADLQEMFLATVTAMASAIDAKSPWTRGHSERMTRHAMAIGKQLGLDTPTLNHLRLGCILHDIGKIGTYESILDKPGRLTDEEMAIMKQHPVRGEEILRPIRQFKPILPVIRHHHEHYDGKGYPDGLKGEDIPLLARIAALADTYDAMTADRPYREASSRGKAIAEIKRCAGTQFDPSIAAVFVTLVERGYQ
jgi:putative nucleotidyltransferase with HDIG domain